MEDVKCMKSTDFYMKYKELYYRVIEEIKRAVTAHNGCFEWYNNDGGLKQYPPHVNVLVMDDELYVTVNNIWIKDNGSIMCSVCDVEYCDNYEVNIQDITSVIDLNEILNSIPATETVDNVTSCPLCVGQKVFWNDPDESNSSGIYEVIKVPDVFEEDSIILISNGISEAEVTIDELWVPAIKE